MMGKKQIIVTVLAVAGAWFSGAAQARGDVDVRWSVNIGGPIGVSLYNQPSHRAPHPVIVAPVYSAPRYVSRRGYGDSDRDGIPNRYDRVYNPRWDRDGDGVPNRYDRHDGRHDYRHDYRHDNRHDNRHDDRHDGRQGYRSGR